MSTAQLWITASAAIIAIIGLAAGLARLFLRPGDRPPPQHAAPPRARPHHSAAERIPTAGELAAWREDWTDAELQALRGDTPLPALPPLEWTLARWEREQESWLEARRREAHEQQLLLAARVWADPWWIR